MNLLEKEWFIAAPWGRICVVAWGNCFDAPVLLCHGRHDSAVTFRHLVKLLPQKFYYISIELPGNGKSDPFPKGLLVGYLDLMYTIEVVRRHFRWEQFVYMAHSMGAVLGRHYNACFPGRLSKVIEIDHITLPYGLKIDDLSQWYQNNYAVFFEKYDVYNAPKETAPALTWEEAIDKTAKLRQIPSDAAREIIERFAEPVGDGRIRLTIDQRLKLMIPPLFSHEQIKTLYTSCRTPTLGIFCSNSFKYNAFKNTPYLLEEDGFEGTYRVRVVEGPHDAHIVYPERMATYISQFLLHGLDGVERKAKL